MTYEELEFKMNEHYAAIKRHKQMIAEIQEEFDIATLYKELENTKNRLSDSSESISVRNSALEILTKALQEEIYRRKNILYNDPEKQMVQKSDFSTKPSFGYIETETMPELVEGENSFLVIN